MTLLKHLCQRLWPTNDGVYTGYPLQPATDAERAELLTLLAGSKEA